MEKSDAILIRRFRFSETSLICIWLTEHFGKVKTSARGALRPKGSFNGKIDLFFRAQIGFQRARTGDIHTLQDVALLAPFYGFGNSYANLVVASYFAEVCDSITEPMDKSHELYDLLTRAVAFLDSRPPTLRAILHFEAEACKILGILEKNANPLDCIVRHIGHGFHGRTTALKVVKPSPHPSAERTP